MIKTKRAMMCLLSAATIWFVGSCEALANPVPHGYGSRWTIYIDFNAGGGSGQMSSVTKTYTYGKRQYYKLPSCKFTRVGYTFAGWSVEDPCADPGVYPVGYSYELCGSDLVLTATWKSNAKTHVLTLHRNNSSGDGAYAKRTVTEGAYFTLPTISSLGWTRSGYTFKGWATYRGASVTYGDGARIYVDSWTDALYAVWEDDTHVMTLYRNNSAGDGAGARRKVPNGGYYTLPTISSLGWWRDGYEFKGWATYHGASVTYGDGARIYVSSGLSLLYAVWEDDTHVLTLYRNNSAGDGAGARRKVPNGGYYTLPTISSLGWWRSGYEFRGWATSRDASEIYDDGARIYVSSGLYSLYAVWVDAHQATHPAISVSDPTPYFSDSDLRDRELYDWHYIMPVFLDANGGSGGPYLVKVEVELFSQDGYSQDGYTLPNCPFTREGYKFVGWEVYNGCCWYDDNYYELAGVELGYAGTYQPGFFYGVCAATALRAKWAVDTSVKTHVLTLYRNNSAGDGAGARRKVPNGGYYTLPTISSLGWTRSGYVFKGWATYRGASVTYGDGARIYVSSGLSSLYAVWEGDTHVLTLCRNNSAGDGAGARRKVPNGGYYTLPTISSLGWTRSGYVFKGWATSRGAAVVYGDGERIYVPSGLYSLYAVWESIAVKYTVCLHRNNSSGDGAIATRTMVVDSWRDLPTISSLGWWRPGYSFAGWSYYSWDDYAYFWDGESVCNLSTYGGDTVHLYAVWE